jgi:hypothetical protein
MKRLFSVVVSCLALLLVAHDVYASQTWNGVTTPANVINQNLIIDGSVGPIQLVNGQTVVQASTQAVNVTISSNPIVTGLTGAAPVLLLQAQNGNAINVALNGSGQNLTFQGLVSTTPLLIIANTDGMTGSRINFMISDGNVLTLEPNTAGTLGVEFYVWMATPAAEVPTVVFERATNGGNPVEISIGNLCVISYLSSQDYSLTTAPVQQGRILFDPQNTGTGRMVVDITNGGAFVIQGHSTSGVTNPTAMTYANVNRAISAGLLATCEIAGTAPCNLLVMNSNATLFALESDPFNDQAVVPYTGKRLGFVLGGAGSLTVDANNYFDYVGLYQVSLDPTTTAVAGFPGVNPSSLLKARNPSAFFVDAVSSQYGFVSTAQISLGNVAGLYFRSGVDRLGNANTNLADPNVFTITPPHESYGAGELVFDVEGPLDVQGSGITTSKIEVLSLQVTVTGGPLQPGGSQTSFPLRTFAVDNYGVFRQYNKAAMLINDQVSLIDVSLDHTDALHKVFQDNSAQSEPTYIGGEKWHIYHIKRPAFQFINANLNVFSNIAFTGLDLVVPNGVTALDQSFNNTSSFIFYYSGYVVEDGTGRMMILGTQIGSTAYDGCTIVSRATDLDIMQTMTAQGTTPTETLLLEVGTNTPQINNKIVPPITNQYGIHTIYLGNSSNITIGNITPFTPGVEALSVLDIEGNYFSFTSQGGTPAIPALSAVTGEGGIFVDSNGTITIGSNYRASIAAMVVKSGNAVINLPETQVFFDAQVGITDWRLDLSTTTTLINATSVIADYTINWLATKKNYAGGYVPYELGSVNIAASPAVTVANITSLPTIVGDVDQLQIQGSRIGDQVAILIDGGWVRELVFERVGSYSAQAAVGLIVLQDDGRVGLGTAERNIDSIEAEVVMGVNGVTIVGNGNGQVDLNSNIIVNNICAVLKGPYSNGNILRFRSEVPQEFRIKSGATFDLSQFVAGDVIEFTGAITMVFEPGSRCVTGGATIRFGDNVVVLAEPNSNPNELFDMINEYLPYNNALSLVTTTSITVPHNELAPLVGAGGVTNTDPFRVRFAGTGTYEFFDKSSFFIPRYAFVGIETLHEVVGTATINVPQTNLRFLLSGDSSVVLGDSRDVYTPGGSLQIGNTQDFSTYGHSITFTLDLEGPNALFSIDSQGFLGLNAGIVGKGSFVPNTWLVDLLFNTSQVIMNVNAGVFDHSRTFSGDSTQASLMAIGNNTSYTLNLPSESPYEQTSNNSSSFLALNGVGHSNITGGGNIALILTTSSGLAVYHPVVRAATPFQSDTLGNVSAVLESGMLASLAMITTPTASNLSALTLFNTIRVQEITGTTASQSLATAAYTSDEANSVRRTITAGFVNNATMGRDIVYDISNALEGLQEDRINQAAQVGAVSVELDNYQNVPGTVIFAQQLF